MLLIRRGHLLPFNAGEARRDSVGSPTSPPVTYVELHAHSAYSFLDGASLPEELALRAAELGYEALALTDHDGVFGSLEFAHAAKAFGVRPITGAEVTLEGEHHVTLLVESSRGYAPRWENHVPRSSSRNTTVFWPDSSTSSK